MNCKKIDEMKKEFNFEENAEVCCACDENEFDDDSLDIEIMKKAEMLTRWRYSNSLTRIPLRR